MMDEEMSDRATSWAMIIAYVIMIVVSYRLQKENEELKETLLTERQKASYSIVEGSCCCCQCCTHVQQTEKSKKRIDEE